MEAVQRLRGQGHQQRRNRTCEPHPEVVMLPRELLELCFEQHVGWAGVGVQQPHLCVVLRILEDRPDDLRTARTTVMLRVRTAQQSISGVYSPTIRHLPCQVHRERMIIRGDGVHAKTGRITPDDRTSNLKSRCDECHAQQQFRSCELKVRCLLCCSLTCQMGVMPRTAGDKAEPSAARVLAAVLVLPPPQVREMAQWPLRLMFTIGSRLRRLSLAYDWTRTCEAQIMLAQ